MRQCIKNEGHINMACLRFNCEWGGLITIAPFNSAKLLIIKEQYSKYFIIYM